MDGIQLGLITWFDNKPVNMRGVDLLESMLGFYRSKGVT